ncbi:MAG: hypothetical protein HFI82_12440 [Eubacterium sp.]|jgi:hypothetical protein|nr:hypothetical protein [Eubacterium sp.]
MSRKKKHKKSDKNLALQTIVLITALLELIEILLKVRICSIKQSIERIEKSISNKEDSTREWCSVTEKELHKVLRDKF